MRGLRRIPEKKASGSKARNNAIRHKKLPPLASVINMNAGPKIHAGLLTTAQYVECVGFFWDLDLDLGKKGHD